MITKEQLIHALTRLDELLQERHETIDLVVVGGAISVLFFENRAGTKDVDTVYPPGKEHVMEELIQHVAIEQQLPHDWMNSSDSDLMHVLWPVPEKGFRILRVVYRETVEPVAVITAFFDAKVKTS